MPNRVGSVFVKLAVLSVFMVAVTGGCRSGGSQASSHAGTPVGGGGEGGNATGGGSCLHLDGVWMGHELDSNRQRKWPVMLKADGDQIDIFLFDGDVTAGGRLAAACNQGVTPNQMRSRVTVSYRFQAVSQPFYAIYELDPRTHTGQLSAYESGTTTFPTTFSAGTDQRLFVFTDGFGGHDALYEWGGQIPAGPVGWLPTTLSTRPLRPLAAGRLLSSSPRHAR